MRNTMAIALWLASVLAALPAAAATELPLVLRDARGRFVRVDAKGVVLADRLFPTERDAFTLAEQPARDGSLVVADADGRRFVITGGETRRLRVGLGAKPADRVVTIFRMDEVPSAIRSALALAIRAVVKMELSDEEYSKVRTRKREKYVKLPAPTLRKPLRTKRHRVLSMEEEYHLQARLDGTPTITITDMPSLKGYDQTGLELLMFVVRAKVPVQGRVRYRIPNALSASTGFRAEVGLVLVGQIRAEQVDGRSTLSPPEVLDLDVTIRSLDLSNDVLSVARGPIEDLINSELRRKKERIRDKANKAIRKAVDDGKFRHPLLRYLGVPEIR